MKRNRAYRTAAQMYPLIEKWQSSGQSRSAYCKANNIAVHLFAYWHRSYQQHNSPPLKEDDRFIALSLLPSPAMGGITIHYPNGNRLLLDAATDVLLLERLVKLNCDV